MRYWQPEGFLLWYILAGRWQQQPRHACDCDHWNKVWLEKSGHGRNLWCSFCCSHWSLLVQINTPINPLFTSNPILNIQHTQYSLSLSLCLQEENNHKCVKVAWSLTTVWQDSTSDLVFIFCIKTVTEIFRRGKIRCLVRDGLIRTPFVAKWLELPCFVFLKHNKPGWKNWCGNPRYKFNAYCCTLNNCPFKSVQLIDNILMLCILLQDTKLDQYFAKWPGFCFFYT